MMAFDMKGQIFTKTLHMIYIHTHTLPYIQMLCSLFRGLVFHSCKYIYIYTYIQIIYMACLFIKGSCNWFLFSSFRGSSKRSSSDSRRMFGLRHIHEFVLTQLENKNFGSKFHDNNNWYVWLKISIIVNGIKGLSSMHMILHQLNHLCYKKLKLWYVATKHHT